MRRFRWVIIPILFIVISTMLPLASTEAAQAETGKPGLEELTTGADSIIVGTVAERTSQWNDERTQIYTSVVVSVEESFKGTLSQDSIAITVPGGEVGEIGQWVSHMPSFDRGERAVLFLKKLPKAKHPKAQLPEAQLEVYGGFRGKLAVKQGKVGNLPLAKFKERVSQALQGQALPDGEIDLPSSPATFPFSYAGFKWPGSSPVVSYRINENTADCTGEGAAVQTAAATWTAAPANFSFSYAGATGATSVGYNDVNEIIWTTSLGAGIIAQATIWYSGDTILENDIQFQDNYAWSIGAIAEAYDVETIALHELGHWLCLDDLYEPADSDKVMYGYGSTGQTKRALHADDIAGIQSIYGVAAATPPTVTNTGATDVISTSAKLNGEITNTGGENPNVTIYYGTTDGGTTAGSWDISVSLGTKGAGTFSTDIFNLNSSTTYHYRCYAENSAGTAWAVSTTNFNTLATSAAEKLIGADDTTIDGYCSANRAFYMKFTCEETGDVSEFKIKCGKSGNVKVAVYADNSGAPGARLSYSNSSQAVAAGWNTLSIPQVHLTQGTIYWLAECHDSASLVGYDLTYGVYRQHTGTVYSTWTWPDPATQDHGNTNVVILLSGWGATPAPSAPTVTNAAATNIASTSARLNGEITDTGNEDPNVTIYYGTTDGETTVENWDNHVDLPGTYGQETFYTDISSLDPSTDYYYTCYAENSGDSAWATPSLSFTTLALPAAPTVTNAAATNIASTSARLNGEITATGGEDPNVTIYYGTTDGGTTPDSWDENVNLGTKGAGTFYTDISSLTASTEYHYRCFAENSGGGAWAGSSETFDTLTEPGKLIGADDTTIDGYCSANRAFYMKFTCEETGDVSEFKIKCGKSGNVKVAVYADNSGAPGARLSYSNSSQAVAAGWNTLSIPQVHLTQGTIYWLAECHDSASLVGYDLTYGVYRQHTGTVYSTWTWPDPATQDHGNTNVVILLSGWGADTPPTPPDSPTPVSPGAAITFKWNPSATATKYHLQVNTTSAFDGEDKFNAELGDVTSREVTGLSVGTTYYWHVKAGNAGGWSDWSSPTRSALAN